MSTQIPIRTSKRTQRVAASATQAVEGKVAEMRAAGEPVISFGAGEPDFPTPNAIKDQGHDAITTNITKYTPAGGTMPLRKAITVKLKEQTEYDYKWQNVVVTNGGKEAIYLAIMALCDDGDEVIVPAPFWVSYPEMVKLADATPVIISTGIETEFKVTREMLDAHTTAKTRAIMLCSPSNPTGSVYYKDELEMIADWMRGNQALLITDELYDNIVYDSKYVRWLEVAPDLIDRTIVINGLSKSVAMTGWRIGFAATTRDEYAKAMLKVQSHSTSHPSSVSQHAALKAYTANLSDEIALMVASFKTRRNWIVNALNDIPGVKCANPPGAFYVFPDLRGVLGKKLKNGKVLNTSEEVALFLLAEAKVGITHGEAFGAPGYARLSYALAMDKIQEGISRIKSALELE
jgi:aspartate aminotransferase